MNLTDLNLTEKDFENLQKALKETVTATMYREAISNSMIKQMFNPIIKGEKDGEMVFEETMKELKEKQEKEIKVLEEEMETLAVKISLFFEYMKINNFLKIEQNEIKG